MTNYDAWYWHFLENYIYRIPTPPPRVRDPAKPLQVIAVGLPRSGTESISLALARLGLEYSYHGWDIVFERPLYLKPWLSLVRRKHFGPPDGDCHITAAEFDAIVGHCQALTDAAASCFAVELIEAYPQAKVILNTREHDLDGWHKSAVKNLIESLNERWFVWYLSWWNTELFWMWHVYERFLWLRLFRCSGSVFDTGIRRNGKWIYREHCNMIRGLLRDQPERLLEWKVEDGWGPICEFLGKEVPCGEDGKEEEFPNVNNAEGYKGRTDGIVGSYVVKAFLNMGIAVAVLGVGIAGGMRWVGYW